MNAEIEKVVRQVITLLVSRRYTELELLTGGARLSAGQMIHAITDYGRHLVSPPADAFTLMDIVSVRNVVPRRWSVTMPLWTEEEGRSDLSIILTLVEEGSRLRVQLDDIHVL